MSNFIGKKISFWSLVKDKITIPTLQRDYIYGAGIEKTEEVLNNMLDTFIKALETGQEETLDFVYGSESKAKEFMPLDGQQRLTTLYLLHYYAALIAKHDNDFSVEDENKIFEILSRFSYATRNCTITFCNQLLISKHKELRDVVANAQNDDTEVISSYLIDLDDFRGSFYTDPTVMSMLVVLDRIHQKFKGMDNLWERLTAEDCPINYYLLNFGIFDLSDDLYNKMNSRGKPLTSFEIFKAKMHKHIKKQNKANADRIAIKLDTDWMQYIWEALNHTKKLKDVDPAYVWFLKNIFRCFDYISGYKKMRFEKLDDNCLVANMKSVWRIKAMENVFDTLATKSSFIPSKVKDDYKGFVNDGIGGDMRSNRMLMLYAIYLGLYYGLTEDEFYYRYRHVRNLINNSTDYIREEFMVSLFNDVAHVMQGKILEKDPQKMNANSWKEEQEKERYRDIWKLFFSYEDINEINGSINAFSVGLNDSGVLTLGDPIFVKKLQTRLEKAAHFFNEKIIYEHDRRSALLSFGSYAMAKFNEPAYRYFGIIMGSWQNFTGFHRYDERHHIMDVFDKIDITNDIHNSIGDISNTAAENWRYYAIKYASIIEVAYRKPDYGYMYFSGVDKQNPFDENKGYLDVTILQSSYYSDFNVEWKMIHRILEQKCKDIYHMFLYHIGGDQILLSKISNDAKIDIQPDGWHLIGIPTDTLDEVGVLYSIVAPHVDEVIDENGNVTTPLKLCDCLIKHERGMDYIEEGEKLLEQLSKKYPSLLK